MQTHHGTIGEVGYTTSLLQEQGGGIDEYRAWFIVRAKMDLLDFVFRGRSFT